MLAFIGSEDLKLLKCLGKSEPPELAGSGACLDSLGGRW